ncbi:MAG: ssrA-binding protein [Parcubacteria group bacterium LiPW_30]|nr:MAG: ssrA-binding protein [Parcubacteria group bacterium LiPW_30]
MSSFIENKKARFNYEITETLEAGIELLGPEVKSIKGGMGSLEGAYAVVRGGEVFLLGSNIPPYQAGNMPKGYDPLRTRKLLLTKKEIIELAQMEQEKKLTIVPLSMYNKKGKVKVSLGVARGKKKFDKRETIKKRDDMREVRRSLKNM